MKLKIRQPELLYTIQTKQLSSKQIYIFTLKKQSKNFLIPIKTAILPVQQPENIPFVGDGFNNNNNRQAVADIISKREALNYQIFSDFEAIEIPP